MVSVVHSVAATSDFEQFLVTLTDGVPPADAERLKKAVEYAWEIYGEKTLGSGERVWSHALGMAVIIAGLKMDVESRIAAVLFAVPAQDEHGIARIEEKFGKPAAHLVHGISRLNKLRPITKMPATTHHRNIHAQLTGFTQGDDDVHILPFAAGNVLFFLHLMQRLNLVAINRRLFKSKPRGSLFHGFSQTLGHFLLLAEQEHRGQLHITGVIV